jgi:hypothetical protein
MATKHVQIESQPVQTSNHSGGGLVGLNPTGKTYAGKLSQPSLQALRHIWTLIRGDAVLAAVANLVLAFHDWISDPPVTERVRIKRYIVETRNASEKRRLAGR